jgi:hypothetical protein
VRLDLKCYGRVESGHIVKNHMASHSLIEKL